MAGPVFNYTVRCQDCGAGEPRLPATYLNRTAMDEWIKYHRSTCTGKHATYCWCDGCQGKVPHPEVEALPLTTRLAYNRSEVLAVLRALGGGDA